MRKTPQRQRCKCLSCFLSFFSEIRVEIKQTRNNFFKIGWSKSTTGRFSNHRTIYISIWVSELIEGIMWGILLSINSEFCLLCLGFIVIFIVFYVVLSTIILWHKTNNSRTSPPMSHNIISQSDDDDTNSKNYIKNWFRLNLLLHNLIRDWKQRVQP